MSLEYTQGVTNHDFFASANVPKHGKLGYVSYIDRRYRGYTLKRYVAVDSMDEVQLYLARLEANAGFEEITYIAR